MSNVTALHEAPAPLTADERKIACVMFRDDMANPDILDAGLNVLPLPVSAHYLCGHGAFNGPGIDRDLGFGCNEPGAEYQVDVHAGAVYACEQHLHLALRYSVRSFLDAS